MNIVKLDNENAKGVATLMHEMKPEWWPTFEEAYGQLTNIDESIGTIGWFLANENGTPIGWTLFRELKCYLSLELECSGFNDNGVLNEGRQLIKNIYNRQPANYTSDAMLNNFVKKASQEKATEYQNKINNLFSQQLAQHNAKMDEIFYKNRENQIAAQNQNRQTIYANQNAKAKNNAATQISN